LVCWLSLGCSGKWSRFSSVCTLGLVDCIFFLLLSKWPIVVASKGGGYFLRVVSDNPRNGGRYSFFMAAASVEIVGEYIAVWANATMLAGVELGCWVVVRWRSPLSRCVAVVPIPMVWWRAPNALLIAPFGWLTVVPKMQGL
jgi:hypothetical protein